MAREEVELDHAARIRDRIGVAMLWLLILASTGAIVFIAWLFVQPASCQCGG